MTSSCALGESYQSKAMLACMGPAYTLDGMFLYITESEQDTPHCSPYEMVISTFFSCIGTSYHTTSGPGTMMMVGEKLSPRLAIVPHLMYLVAHHHGNRVSFLILEHETQKSLEQRNNGYQLVYMSGYLYCLW